MGVSLPAPMDEPAADEVRIMDVDDGDAAPVNALLRGGWHLLACGVVEHRTVLATGQPAINARCTFILGRSRADQVLAEATAVVESVGSTSGAAAAAFDPAGPMGPAHLPSASETP